MRADIQLNYLLVMFLALYVLAVSTRMGLYALNVRHLRGTGTRVPEEFSGAVDRQTMEKMRAYAVATGRLSAVEHLSNDILLLVLVLGGLPVLLSGVLSSWGLPFILSGILFFFAWYLIFGAFEIPFELYRTFDLEKRFSFSTISLSTWIADLVKSVLVSAVVLGILLFVFLGLVGLTPRFWWLLSWLFFVSFQLLVSWLYPVLIAPLFNTFEPVDDRDLARDISSLAEQAGFTVTGVYQMDALKRSRHSNAYFTGVGKSKRIVLFDTLLKSHGRSEILAILAHELGHWKLGHVLKQVIFSAGGSLLALYGAYLALQHGTLYQTFGFDRVVVYAGILLLAVLVKPAVFFLHPLGAMISRHFERQADDYSSGLLGSPEPLIRALKNLARQNLSNLNPHPVYAWFYYSHPPIVERIRRLERNEKSTRALFRTKARTEHGYRDENVP